MAEKFLEAAKLRRMRVEQLSTPATDSQVTVDEDPELRRVRILGILGVPGYENGGIQWAYKHI